MAETKQILVIDDDPDFLDYVRIVLTANGYAVRTATSAQEGLEMMRALPPDLALLDVMMSYALDGWNVTREMQFDPRLRHVPVMLVSAIVSKEEDALFPTDQSHIAAFMSKPIEPAALLRRVAELVG